MTIDSFHLPLAQSGFTFLIYLILGVFWLVGNIARQKKAKAKVQEMRHRREEREREEARTGKKPSKPHPLERDLESFLGRLTGETPPPPPPLPTKQKPVEIQFDQEPPPSRAPTPAPTSPLDMDTSFGEIQELQDAVEISYDQLEGVLNEQALASVKQVKIDLSPIMMDMPRVPTPSLHSVQTKTNPPNLKRRTVFKKALVSSTLIGPPVALQDPSANAS